MVEPVDNVGDADVGAHDHAEQAERDDTHVLVHVQLGPGRRGFT